MNLLDRQKQRLAALLQKHKELLQVREDLERDISLVVRDGEELEREIKKAEAKPAIAPQQPETPAEVN